ncbi:hypothetical protein N7532_002626 [Penicillium argentinense]|uniref:Uncharacterized protein n=1 Tax=Penicillium argentinense TaxID=1131581 RepID=A0A9W9KLE9_9EURO|nr:uncharacterized protein N7532_002626 [Penicillium argentinense]KAJ5109981.1 hypothetical protein N7532_002626 [Penicillium argentinense]
MFSIFDDGRAGLVDMMLRLCDDMIMHPDGNDRLYTEKIVSYLRKYLQELETMDRGLGNTAHLLTWMSQKFWKWLPGSLVGSPFSYASMADGYAERMELHLVQYDERILVHREDNEITLDHNPPVFEKFT